MLEAPGDCLAVLVETVDDGQQPIAVEGIDRHAGFVLSEAMDNEVNFRIV